MDMASFEFKLRRVEPEAGILKALSLPLSLFSLSAASVTTVSNWSCIRAAAAATPLLTLADHLPGDFAPKKGKYDPYLRYRIRARLVNTGGGAAAPTLKLQGLLRWHNPAYNANWQEVAGGADDVMAGYQAATATAADVSAGGFAVLAASDTDYAAIRTYEIDPLAGMTVAQKNSLRPEAALLMTIGLSAAVPANTRLDIFSVEKVYRSHVSLLDIVRRMFGAT